MKPHPDATQSGSSPGPAQAPAAERADGQFGTPIVDLTGYAASGEPLGKGGYALVR